MFYHHHGDVQHVWDSTQVRQVVWLNAGEVRRCVCVCPCICSACLFSGKPQSPRVFLVVCHVMEVLTFSWRRRSQKGPKVPGFFRNSVRQTWWDLEDVTEMRFISLLESHWNFFIDGRTLQVNTLMCDGGAVDNTLLSQWECPQFKSMLALCWKFAC